MKLLSLLFLCGSLSVQDATPSLSETIQWLEKSLPSQANHTDKLGKMDFSSQVSQVEFNKCAVALTVDSIVNGLGSPQSFITTKQEVNFSLEQMDVEQVYITGKSPFSLLLKTKSEQPLVKLSTHSSSLEFGHRDSSKYVKKVSLPMLNRGTAEQFQKVFTQAIRLCQAPK